MSRAIYAQSEWNFTNQAVFAHEHTHTPEHTYTEKKETNLSTNNKQFDCI